MIISTGMLSLKELKNIVNYVKKNGCKKLILLKCTSAYPAKPEDANLITLQNMAQTFDVIPGLSDHTLGIGAAIAGVALGAVAIEKHFIKDSLPVSLIGMNADKMSQYIEFVADRLLKDLGHSKLYNTKNPFSWMEMLGLEGKTNFFERKVSEYAKAGVTSGNNDLTWGEDF